MLPATYLSCDIYIYAMYICMYTIALLGDSMITVR